MIFLVDDNGWPSAGLFIRRLGLASRGVQKGLDKLDSIRFSGYKFQFSSAKGACISSVPMVRNELKSALAQSYQAYEESKYLQTDDITRINLLI
ncbi:hypothetical protein TNCV_3306421 [Trichonephila clavipes]|nr:hypothetical protein TNCV_3306421 [Trichonephila clavipes]